MEPWIVSRAAAVTATKLYEQAGLPNVSDLDWLIVMGGPMSVNDEQAYSWLVPEKRLISEAVASSKVVLGVCLGAQLIASSLGTQVMANREREIGWFPIEPAPGASASPFSRFFGRPLEAFHWHGETFDLPPGAVHLARSVACEHQAFSIGDRVLGLQFHLETTPETAQALFENCPDELTTGRWVQSPGEMLRSEERFRRINRVMTAVLDYLEDLAA